MAADATIEIVFALPGRQRVVRLGLPATGLTATEAVERSGLLDEFPELRERPLVLGVFGKVCTPDHPLRERDRVEIYRPLRLNPREQRRERAATASRAGKGRKR
jgi:hypothetical protein